GRKTAKAEAGEMREECRIDAVPWRHQHGQGAVAEEGHEAAPAECGLAEVDLERARRPELPALGPGGGMVDVLKAVRDRDDPRYLAEDGHETCLREVRDGREGQRDAPSAGDGEEPLECGCRLDRIVVAPPQGRTSACLLPGVKLARERFPTAHG